MYDDPHAERSQEPLRDRVLAILVVTGEQPWHEVVAARLSERGGAANGVRLLVVDNGGAPAAARIAADLSAPLISFPRRRAFGNAVAGAVNHPDAGTPEFLLLLHDDLILDEHAVDTMVAVMDQREQVAVTGPKLLEWRREPTLQQVGMTIDSLGRAETHLYPGEVDQGQHDHRAETLYVSTAGMLVRREVFLELRGFDPRFSVMRDDLDLCWRAWLAGHEVEVVPEAVGWHVGAAGRAVRHTPGRRATTRYLAERHTLAAMLKNLGVVRLLWTLPVYGLLALARMVGFVLTRRVASAAAPVAAVGWNVRNLPGTLRLRRTAQRSRERSDSELADLFARTSWRTRAYIEALGDWVRGVNTRALVDDDTVARKVHRSHRSALFAPFDALRARPVAIGGPVLLILWILAVLPLLGGGPLIGGQVAAWPAHASEFLSVYAAGWSEGPLATGGIGSPVQPLLGVLGLLVGGGAWLAQRLVVLGLVPFIWIVTVRAGRLLTSQPGPRVVGATLYTASPLVLGAFGQGRLDLLAVAAALPASLLLAARVSQAGVTQKPAGAAGTGASSPVVGAGQGTAWVVRPGSAPSRAWRATALLAVTLAAALSVAPTAWPVLLLPVAGIVMVGWLRRTGRTAVLTRAMVAVLGAVALLVPWLLALRADTVVAPAWGAAAEGGDLRLWQAMIGFTDLLPGMDGVAGWLWIAAAVLTVVAAVVLGLGVRAYSVVALTGAVVAFGVATAVLARQPSPGLWPPIAALPSLLALAGLAVTAARVGPEVLRRHRLGLRHVVAVVAALSLVAGTGAVLTSAVALSEWPQLRRAPEVRPLFVEADAERLGAYRVVLLDGDADRVEWSVTEPDGPHMTTYNAGTSRAMTAALDDAVAGLLAGDRRAAGSLGALNVRYVVLRDAATRDAVAPSLADLPAVEPLAARDGTVYQLRTWLPRGAVLPPGVVATALAGEPVDAERVEAAGLERVAVDRFVGGPTAPGALVVSEAGEPAWRASADGRPLELVPELTALPVPVFSVDRAAEGVAVTADPGARTWWIVWQVAVLLVLLSLALRAPGRDLRPAPPDPTAVPGATRSPVTAAPRT